MKWDKRFLDLACLVSGWSKDPATKVGAVIVNERKQILGIGFNGFPRGIEDKPELYANREIKLLYVSHAERNALDNCLVDLFSQNATIYCTLFPCPDCAKGIIQRGIKRIVSFYPDSDRHRPEISTDMFKQAGIEVILYPGGYNHGTN